MSSQPLMSTDAPDNSQESMKSKAKRGCRTLGYGCGLVLLVVFICAWIVQGFMFYFATSVQGCTASKLEGYTYPAGESSDAGGPGFNLMPQIHLLAERTPMWYGEAFDVIPSNSASNVVSAPVGVWWQNWGPIFYTYTFEDVAYSHTTLYMRRKLLRLGECYVVERCDGKGPVVTLSEGSNWVSNRLRRFFRMNQGMSYKVYLDDELVALAEETNRGFQSLTFRTVESGDLEGSSVLKERHFHGNYDLWLVNNGQETQLPYYVPSAATLLFAFRTLEQDRKYVHSQGKTVTDPSKKTPNFLASSLENLTLDAVPASAVVSQATEAPEAPAAPEVEVLPSEHRV